MLDYVLNSTEFGVMGYVGHSSGSQVAVTYLSMTQKYDNLIRPLVGLASSLYPGTGARTGAVVTENLALKKFLAAHPMPLFRYDPIYEVCVFHAKVSAYGQLTLSKRFIEFNVNLHPAIR